MAIVKRILNLHLHLHHSHETRDQARSHVSFDFRSTDLVRQQTDLRYRLPGTKHAIPQVTGEVCVNVVAPSSPLYAPNSR